MPQDVIRDEALAECLEDHYRRRARGEPEVLDGYAAKLGGQEQAEFRRILATAEALDALLEPAETTLPRPFGAYTLLREIGRGAMGVVYEALHRDLGRKVALKVLRSGVDLDTEARQRFRREARSCAQVRHPNIVEIYEAGEHDGQPYYAMQLVAGRPLSEMAREGRFKDSRELFRGIAGIADALAALHAAGIVHRDVKPSNVIVAADGRMILADFGLARSLSAERMTATGQALGTPLYMSPEQVMGKADAIDGRADVYSLGVTLYEVLAGRGPFQADDAIAMLRMILRERPDPLADVAPGVPAAACAVVMKTLEKLPADRYPDAAGLRDDLLAHADGRAVEGRPVSAAVRAVRTARRFAPAAAAAAALLGVALYASATRSGTLTVRSVPPADLRIDGASFGATPQVNVAVAPGEHRLELVKSGWTAAPKLVPVAPGSEQTFELLMLPDNPDDLASLRLLGEQVGVSVQQWTPAQDRAGGDGDPVIAVFPRGRVRLADLDRLRVDVADTYEPGGRIVLERHGETLATIAFAPEKLVSELTIPTELRQAVKAGDTIDWGYVSPSGKRFVTRIEVVADDPAAARFAAVASLFGDDRPIVRCHLEAQALLDAGLDYAAYRAAAEAARCDPKSARAWTAMQVALERLGLCGSNPCVEAAKGRAAAGGAK